MFLLKKKSENQACFGQVSVNDRVQLDVAGRSYLTRVEDIKEKYLLVGTPLDKDWPGESLQNQLGVLNVFAASGFRRFNTRIAGFMPARIPLTMLAHVKDLGVLDRRRYDRIAAELKVRYRMKTNRGDSAPWSNATTTDVSGSGLRIACNGSPGVAANEYVDIELLVGLTENPVPAAAQVAWVASASKTDPRPSFGAHFVVIHHADRVRIVDYVKRHRAEVRSWRRKDPRAPVDMPVNYRVIKDGRAGDWQEATSTDVSASGLRMLHERAVCKSGDRCDAQFQLPDSSRAVSAAGTISWVSPGKKGEGLSLGVQFESISPEDRKLIESFVIRKLDSFQPEHKRIH
jgi:c-di-GMP-binding flagellar brake protein YcgR